MQQPMPDGPGRTSGTVDDTLAELERIARIGDPKLRNLLITQTYCELSQSIAGVTGTGNANWSTFATWASKTAGQSIRGEEVPPEVAAVLSGQGALEARLAALNRRFPVLGWLKANFDAADVPRAFVAEVARQIADGNLKVFAELAPLFARFVHVFSDPGQRTPAELESFVAILRAGSAAEGGQDSLKLAFTSYLAAANAADRHERAELVLYANLLIGLHEQTRLQPNIQAAIDAPFSPRVHADLAAGTIWSLPGLRALVEWQLNEVFGPLRDPWERIITEYMMRLLLPNGVSVPLGQDLVVAGRPFPPDLDPLHHPDLIALIRGYDPNLETLEGSGARNWTVLGNRMAFIADLFRATQCDEALFEPPFTADQIVLIRAGTVPPGPL